MPRKKDDSRFTQGFEDLKDIASTNFDRHMEAATKKIMGEVYHDDVLAAQGQRELEVTDRTGDGLFKIHHDGNYVDPNVLHDATQKLGKAAYGSHSAKEVLRQEDPGFHTSREREIREYGSSRSDNRSR